MRILGVTDDTLNQTEELSINGASLILYSIRALDTPFTDSAIEGICKSVHFKRIGHNQGYAEKIFKLDNLSTQGHITFVYESKHTKLSAVELSSGSFVRPIINYYVTLFSKNILLIQSVIVFDRNDVTSFSGKTIIPSPLSTNDILKIIHSLKNAQEDWHNEMISEVDRLVDWFLYFLRLEHPLTSFISISDQNEQCLSFQIWDIESIRFKEDDEVNGAVLAERYELELSAILSCHNEHFSKDELWKKASANQVHSSALSKTDVLMDHQVLVSERVCVEISQVDHPTLRHISELRLSTYGYDSTSIFLWGCLVITNVGLEVCNTKAIGLQERITEHTLKHDWTNEEVLRVAVDKQKISKEIDQYSSLKKLCIERRHKDFISNGEKIKGIDDTKIHINQVFESMKELSSLFVATDTSSNSNEISELLKEVKEMNKQDGIAATLLAIIGILVGVLTINPISELLPTINKNDTWKLIVLGVFIGVGISVLLYNVKKFLRGKSK